MGDGGKRNRPRVLVAIALVVLAVGGLGAYWLVQARRFVSTDNAQIDGDQIVVNAPATGRLIEWEVREGRRIEQDQVLGEIQLPGAFVGPQLQIRAPGAGVVARESATEGAFVQAGERLAVAYRMGRVYVTARVDGTDISDVRVGAPVDIELDAYGQQLRGVVQEVQSSTASEFSLFPEANSSGQYQKVTQVIPVKIALTGTGGLRLVPGMSVTVHIHKIGTAPFPRT